MASLIKNGKFAQIILDRPKRGNALNLDMINDVMQHLDSLREDSSIRVVVITGRGK